MRILFGTVLLVWIIALSAQPGTMYAATPDEGGISSSGQVYSRLSQIPLHFAANQGQMDEAVAYYARSENAFVCCTYQGVDFQFPGGSVSLKLYGRFIMSELLSEAQDSAIDKPAKYVYIMVNSSLTVILSPSTNPIYT